MVDPLNVTDFGRTRDELEEYWLFCLAVAGKKASVIAAKIDEFLSEARAESPLSYVRRLDAQGALLDRLVAVKIGKYGLLARAYSASAAPGAPDLATAGVEALESLPGVGPKTARYFLLHTRRNACVAVIDTHVLKYLRALGHDVSRGFPSARDYLRLEKIMLAEMDASGMGPAEFDLAVWSHYATKGERPLPGIGRIRQ